MTDRDWSAGCVVAYSLWGIAVGLLALAWLHSDGNVGRTGVGVAVVAATATIRVYLCRQDEHLRNAFALGRDSVTSLPRQRDRV